MRRLKLGDIVEIATGSGLAYAQYTQKHSQYGVLITIFPGLHSDRPQSFEDITRKGRQFECFFLLGLAVRRGYVSIVGNLPVSAPLATFPLFRTGIIDPSSGKVPTWWLWNGESEWPVGQLTAEQKTLSILGIWNHALLVERIEDGYTPDQDSTN